jgi:hypothetical protein
MDVRDKTAMKRDIQINKSENTEGKAMEEEKQKRSKLLTYHSRNGNTSMELFMCAS